MNIANFEKVIGVLQDLQTQQIIEKYAIGGAFAATLHNEPISTIDLDIFFFLKEKSDSLILSMSKIYEFAKENGFKFDHEFINLYGWLVQFVEASHNELWKEAIENSDTLKFDGVNVSVIGREYLVAMWLFAGRAKDYQKITAFLDAEIVDKKKLFEILERHNLSAKWNKEKWRFINEE
ncbi:MAG TPA: hypothetical protein PKY59_08095 [Pyrinomonadaceae bacterium]|nr:hypothetical protein [Pyrinomonadaceae bacterium]